MWIVACGHRHFRPTHPSPWYSLVEDCLLWNLRGQYSFVCYVPVGGFAGDSKRDVRMLTAFWGRPAPCTYPVACTELLNRTDLQLIIVRSSGQSFQYIYCRVYCWWRHWKPNHWLCVVVKILSISDELRMKWILLLSWNCSPDFTKGQLVYRWLWTN